MPCHVARISLCGLGQLVVVLTFENPVWPLKPGINLGISGFSLPLDLVLGLVWFGGGFGIGLGAKRNRVVLRSGPDFKGFIIYGNAKLKVAPVVSGEWA